MDIWIFFMLLSETNYLLCKKNNYNKKVGSALIIFAANEHVFNAVFAILLIVLNDKSLWSKHLFISINY